MSNTHQDKYLTKLLIGIALITTSIVVLFYTIYERSEKVQKEEDWYLWALAFAVLLIAGVISICQAFVHKIKSDLIRRQKQREHHKTSPKITEEEM